MLGIGIKGALWGCQALLSHMKAGRSHRPSSTCPRPWPSAATPTPRSTAPSRAPSSTLTKTLAAELGPRGVRVNALAPGSVPTPGAMGLNDQAEYERRARTIPLRRLGHEDDVAAAAMFLLSPAAAFINGEILHVDGGIAAAG